MVARAQTIEEIMQTEAGRFLEVHRGLLREKPTDMSVHHNECMWRLTRQLALQLEPDRFAVRTNTGRVRHGDDTWYIPDIYVVPRTAPISLRDASPRLEVFDDPLPLVAEFWSPSTGGYDVAAKLPEYMRRGDQEILFVHPVDLTLTSWRRRADGSYAESVHRGGLLELHAVPGVVIDLEALFA